MPQRLNLDVERIRRLYFEEKMSTPTIGKIFNCTSNVIERRLRELGLKLRTAKEVWKLRTKHPRDKNLPIKEICEEYIKEEISPKSLIKKYNISYTSLYKILKKNKINIKGQGYFNKIRLSKYHHFKGKHHTQETLAKIRLTLAKPEVKKRMIEANSGANNFYYGKHHSDEEKIEIGLASKRMWSDPIKKKEIMKKALHSLFHNRPTNYEKKVAELCLKNNIPFIYTGDGKFILSFNKISKNPDFIYLDKKIAIEVFFSYFKTKDYGSVENYKEYCDNIYHKNGWKVIYLDENEITCNDLEEKCLAKIKPFL